MEIDSIRITREKWRVNSGKWRGSGKYQVAKNYETAVRKSNDGIENWELASSSSESLISPNSPKQRSNCPDRYLS